MAWLHNRSRTLRVSLRLVAPRSEGGLLAACGVEFLDGRDHAYWPLMTLPVLHLADEDADEVSRAIGELVSRRVPGVAFQLGMGAEVALQLGRQVDGLCAEVGFDLAAVVRETSGVPGEAGRELALFRLDVAEAEVAQFAGQLRDEHRALGVQR